MPRPTEWIHRIPNALRILEESAGSPALLDRRDIERLLDVSPRQALRILTQLGPTQLGKNLFISVQDFADRIRAVSAGEQVDYERRRLSRVCKTLAEAEHQLRARNVPVPVTRSTHHLSFPALPNSVRLRPGRLEIDFSSPEELLTRLYELSQALVNDYDTFAASASSERLF